MLYRAYHIKQESRRPKTVKERMLQCAKGWVRATPHEREHIKSSPDGRHIGRFMGGRGGGRFESPGVRGRHRGCAGDRGQVWNAVSSLSAVEVVDSAAGHARTDNVTTRDDLGIKPNGPVRRINGPLPRPTSGIGTRRFDDFRLATSVPRDLVILTAVSTIKRSIVILDQTPIDRSSPARTDRADPQSDLLGLNRKTEVAQSPFDLLVLDLGLPHLEPLGRGDHLGRLVEEFEMEDDLMSSTVRGEADDQAAGEVDLVVARLSRLGGFVEDRVVGRGQASEGGPGGCEVDEAGHWCVCVGGYDV
jgi:hypothetical protein